MLLIFPSEGPILWLYIPTTRVYFSQTNNKIVKCTDVKKK